MFKPLKANAELLYDTFNTPLRKKAPNGWKTLGEGAYRAAYLHSESNVVYKLGDADINHSEVARSKSLRANSKTGFHTININNVPVKVYIPKTKAFSIKPRKKDVMDGMTIIAMERAVGKRTNCQSVWGMGKPCNCNGKNEVGICYAAVHPMLNKEFGLYDMHGDNVLYDVKTKTLTIIDLGEEYSYPMSY